MLISTPATFDNFGFVSETSSVFRILKSLTLSEEELGTEFLVRRQDPVAGGLDDTGAPIMLFDLETGVFMKTDKAEDTEGPWWFFAKTLADKTSKFFVIEPDRVIDGSASLCEVKREQAEQAARDEWQQRRDWRAGLSSKPGSATREQRRVFCALLRENGAKEGGVVRFDELEKSPDDLTVPVLAHSSARTVQHFIDDLTREDNIL